MAGRIITEMWVEQWPESAVSLAHSSKTIWTASIAVTIILIQNTAGGSLTDDIT